MTARSDTRPFTRKPAPRLGVCVLLVALLLLAGSAYADIAVIVHADNPVQSLTTRQTAELYLGRVRTFDTGQYALVIDQGRDDPLRGRFFKDVSGMSIGQVTAYWSRLQFTGQVQPPRNLEGDAAVLDFVRRNPAAIGYISTVPALDAKVKTVLVLREQ
ncbi:MAG: phosphate ABC transporter substrate-binding protein [Pseudomonadota bacterium]